MRDVVRQRLIESLDSPLPLVIVEGPPGAGKRTLIAHWASQPGESHRFVVSVPMALTRGVDVVRLLWNSLARQSHLILPPLPPDDDHLVDHIRTVTDMAHRPVVIAITDLAQLGAADYDLMMRALSAIRNFRVIIATHDATLLMQAARRQGVSYRLIDDQHLQFDPSETRELLDRRGIDISDEAAARLHRVSGGHVGAMLAAVEDYPTDSRLGTITTDQALESLLRYPNTQHWPRGVLRFLAVLSQVPRFSVDFAHLVVGHDEVDRHIHRLQTLGLGRLSFSEHMQQLVFTWRESVRQVLKQVSAHSLDDDADHREMIIAASRATGDWELMVATLVELNRFSEAEQVLTDRLWEVLPDGPGRLWQRLGELGMAALADHPGLLCIRYRLVVGGGRATRPALPHRVAGELIAEHASDPWRRLVNLARAVELARQIASPDLVRKVVAQATELVAGIQDLPADAIPPSAVSDVLIIAESCFRLGDGAAASRFAQRALDFIEDGPVRLDPHSQRRWAAQRLVLYSRRERGLTEPSEAEFLLVGSQYLTGDVDFVAAFLAMAWADLDARDPATADERCRAAMDKVADPGQWPLLLFLRCLVLVGLGQTEELRAMSEAYSRACGMFDVDRGSGPSLPTPLLEQLVGPGFSSPEFLVSEIDPAPRFLHARNLDEALSALRAGRIPEARSALERALEIASQRALIPLALTTAGSEEIQELRMVLDSPADAEVLGLDSALEQADGAARTSLELSAREHEILVHLRSGLSNKAMAETLFISVNTVKFHRGNLLRKLGATSREEALEAAARHGL